jgi:lysophospholipase L1-like esterase
MYVGRLLRVATCAVVSGLVFGMTGASAAASTPSVQYYVSLGDSLSVGIQPNSDGRNVLTDQGYADQLYKIERWRVPNLKLVKFGCSGETTDSMLSATASPITEVRCLPEAQSQLSEAAAFLNAHSGSIAFVTIDIGANDLAKCVSGLVIDPACVNQGFASAEGNLRLILSTLRTAAGRGTPIVGMTYYDPYLASWLAGTPGQSVAKASAKTLSAFNALLKANYAAVGAPVADVERTFLTSDFQDMITLNPFGLVPLNVAVICKLTWMCAAPPVGPNIHANVAGYAAIAVTFATSVPIRR